MKYKKGDKLTVAANTSDHGFEIGEVIEVAETYYDEVNPNFGALDSDGEMWYIYDEYEVK